MLAGTGPPLTVAVPPHWLQLRVLSSRWRYSPPAFRSWWPFALYEYVKSSWIVYVFWLRYRGMLPLRLLRKPRNVRFGPPLVMPLAASQWFDHDVRLDWLMPYEA